MEELTWKRLVADEFDEAERRDSRNRQELVLMIQKTNTSLDTTNKLLLGILISLVTTIGSAAVILVLLK